MTEGFLPFFRWCETTFIAEAINNSIWLFAGVEAVHLVGLSMLGGAILLVDLRMMGFGLVRTPLPDLVRQARPWLVTGIAIMVVTGVSLFLSEAIKCYYNASFWVKMLTLPLAMAFTFKVRDRIAEDGWYVNAATRQAGAASITLWLIVAAAGRWIGFS